MSWLGALSPVVLAIAGSSLLLMADVPLIWFFAAMVLFLWGAAVRTVAIDRHWIRARKAIRLSPMAGLRAAFSLYIAAGVAGAVGGFVHLGRAGGSIVLFFMVSWVSMWAWFLSRVQ